MSFTLREDSSNFFTLSLVQEVPVEKDRLILARWVSSRKRLSVFCSDLNVNQGCLNAMQYFFESTTLGDVSNCYE